MAQQKKFIVKNGLIAAGLTYPTSDGTANQVIATDGSGNLTFNTPTTYSVGDGGLTQNNFTDALKTKLDGIETGATADQTQAEINALGITATGLSGSPSITVSSVTTTGNITFGDNDKAVFGASDDLQIYHNGTDSTIENNTGDLYITNKADDKDVIFRSDDGSGGYAEYIRLDGSDTSVRVSQHLKLPDSKAIYFGDGEDLNIWHSGTNSLIDHIGTGNLYLRNTTNDASIYLQSDNGSGGLASYIIANGSSGTVTLSYYGSQKLVTKSDGVDITGELQSDSLDVDGAADISGNLTIGGEIYAKDSNSTTDPTVTFTGHTTTGMSVSYSGSQDELNLITGGVRRVHVNGSGIFSSSNVYSGTSSQFRNYGGTWQASTGLTGNGFEFINSVDGTAMTLSSVGLMSLTGASAGVAATKGAFGVNGLHASYDLYNNGTTYLNGAVTVDDNLQVNNIGVGAAANVHGIYVYHTDNFEAAKFETNQGGSLARFTDTTASIEMGVQAGKPVIRTSSTARLTVDGANVQINSGALQMGSTTVIDSGRNLTNIANITTTGYLRGPASFTIDPAAHGDDTGTVVIAGNLQVDGTTTTINSTTVTVDDKVLELANGAANAAAADGAGITIAGAGKSMVWDNTNQYFEFNTDVYSSGFVVGTTDTKVGQVQNASGVMNIQAYTARQISFGNDTNGEHVRIDASGNVGIGTSSPDVPLEVVSASPTNGIIADFVNSTNAGGTIAAIKLSNADSEACDVVLGANRVGANFGSDFFISLSDSVDGSNQERFRITEAGNVGIGTSSPANKLHVSDGGGAGLEINPQTANDRVILFAYDRSASTYQELDFDASEFHFNVSGAEKVRINSSGNVGIGTSSPGRKLHVYDNNAAAIKIQAGDANQARLDLANSAGAFGIITNDGALRIYDDTDAAERLRIDTSGNVGIGTTSPSELLELSRTAGRIGWGMNGDYGVRIGYFDDGGGVHGFHIDTKHAGTTTNESRFVVRADSGNVGIGIKSPAQKLHVNGTVEVNGNIYFDGSTTGNHSISYGTSTQQPAISFWGEDHASYPGQVHIVGRSDNAAGNAGEISFWDYTGSGWHRNMVIKKDGKVGIGADSPSEKLEVNGNIKHTGLTMTSGTDIDQLYTATVSLQLSTSWQDTGINGTDLSSGTYIFSVAVNDNGVDGQHYNELYSGVVSWYNGNTNSTETDEILLHRAGHAPNAGVIYLRTERVPSADANDLMLQMRGDLNTTGNSNYVFKFRRMI